MMPRSLPDADPSEGAVLRAMVFLSTLTTAAEVWHAAKERRAGRDPSAQEEPHVVAPWLREGRRELQEMLMRLRASLVYTSHHEEDDPTHLVRRFDDLMTLGRVGRLLHRMHQRLLSLYPSVSEGLVEEIRVLEAACQALTTADEDGFAGVLGPFLEDALVFSARLREEVG